MFSYNHETEVNVQGAFGLKYGIPLDPIATSLEITPLGLFTPKSGTDGDAGSPSRSSSGP